MTVVTQKKGVTHFGHELVTTLTIIRLSVDKGH